MRRMCDETPEDLPSKHAAVSVNASRQTWREPFNSTFQSLDVVLLGAAGISGHCSAFLHEGGRLTVEHGIECQTFDWSLAELPNEPLLQWGAFYSDCKHEVHPVTSGARITVAYNLMAVKAEDPPLRVSQSRNKVQRPLLIISLAGGRVLELLCCTMHELLATLLLHSFCRRH